MLFNSWAFAIFLPIVFILYWVLPHKFRWALILAASYYFYMSWNVQYIVLIVFTTAVSYGCALLMGRTPEKPKRRKWLLTAALVACLGVLFFFKYFNFFSNSLTDLLQSFAIPVSPFTLNIMLPVGISFYTFQTLGYVIDVYRGDIEPEKHFGKYAAFISFFPQLVAGPIERASNLLPQIQTERHFSYDDATYGLKLMAWGFFKKMVIADTIAVYVDRVYNNLPGVVGFSLIFATLLFAVQIYCDFSGYSDIAIGVGRLFGINLMTNFKSPYFSASIREFWDRWHISLSSWFRDYLYIPLGGNRKGKWRTRLNTFITFLVSGLWHGANWTFLIWGGLHGLALSVESLLLGKKRRARGEAHRFSIGWLLSVIVVFIFCCAAWVFFRADSLSDAIYVFRNSFVGLQSPLSYITNCYYVFFFENYTLPKLALVVLMLGVFDYVSLKRDVIQCIGKWPLVWRWCVYIVIVLLIIWLTPSVTSEFIYFEF